MEYSPEDLVRILSYVYKKNGTWFSVQYDKLCKFKDLSEEKQVITSKISEEKVRLVFMTP